MGNQQTLIFIGAHPDDESFSVGATLAHYSLLGVKVYYVCATRGEAGEVNSAKLKGYASISELRNVELQNAAKVLGLTDVIYLGYRDSGMSGWKDNKHPLALINVPIEQVVSKIVKIFRELKPDVVITFDPNGGYNHPDHITVHKATVKAFYAAGDSNQFIDSGLPFQPFKLYFRVSPHRILSIIVRILSFLGINMHKWGPNNKIDLENKVKRQFPVHAVIRISKKAVDAKNMAALCHASMVSSSYPHRSIFNLPDKILGYRNHYMRAHPPVKKRLREHDLFQGIQK